MREVIVRILFNENSNEVRAIATEKDGETESTYPLHQFDVAFVAAITPDDQRRSLITHMKDIYHFRRKWDVKPDQTRIPSVPTPTLIGAGSGQVLCVMEASDLDRL